MATVKENAVYHNNSLIEKLGAVQQFVGNTPLFPITKLHSNPKVKIFAKMEWQQLGMSVKTRPAFNIIKQAVLEGKLDRERNLLDASSGNTGVAYAAIGAALGIPVTLCIPENTSLQKKYALKFYGAKLIETSKFDSTDGSQEKAKQLFAENPDKYYYADQYNNDNNWKAHYNTTGEEIFSQTEKQITHFIAGLGTTGTFTGTSRKLKQLNSNIKVVSLQPDFALHGLEGWKHMETAKVPGIYDTTLADENREVGTGDAYDMIVRMAKLEGVLLSSSSAANVVSAVKLANEIEEGVIVTVFPDHGSNYQEVLNELIR